MKNERSGYKIATAALSTLLAAELVTLGVALSEISDASSEPVISLDAVPSTLPAPVARETDAAVSIETDIPPDSGSSLAGSLSIASGVRVGTDLYLTAGHAVDFDGSANRPNAVASCSPTFKVFADYQKPFDFYPVTHLTYPGYNSNPGVEVMANKAIGSYINGDNTKTPDIGIIHTTNYEDNYVTNKSVEVSSHPVQVGQTLYFVNYQPEPNETLRSPDIYEVTNINREYAQPIKGRQLYSPAIYAGKVVGFERNGDIDIVDRFHSYDEAGDSQSIPGASGGEVLNEDGQLVGLSIEGTYPDKRSTKEFNKDFGVDITGAKKGQKFTEAVVQPVTTGLINKLKAKLATVRSCPKYGDIRPGHPEMGTEEVVSAKPGL